MKYQCVGMRFHASLFVWLLSARTACKVMFMIIMPLARRLNGRISSA